MANLGYVADKGCPTSSWLFEINNIVDFSPTKSQDGLNQPPITPAIQYIHVLEIGTTADGAIVNPFDANLNSQNN